MEKRRKRSTGNSFEDHVSKETKRKKTKPITEKLRRERINNSLEELKFLILSAMNEDVSHYAKMEKADILEMTVKYVKRLQTEEPKYQGKVQAQCSSQSSDSTASSQNEPDDGQPKPPCSLDLVLPTIPESAVFQSVAKDTPSRVETGTVETNHAMMTSCSRLLANDCSVNIGDGTNSTHTLIDKKDIFSYSDKIAIRRAPFSAKEPNTINAGYYKEHLSPNRVAVTNHVQNVRLPGMECFIKNNFKNDIFSRETVDKENASLDVALDDQYHSSWQMAFDDAQYSLWRPW